MSGGPRMLASKEPGGPASRPAHCCLGLRPGLGGWSGGGDERGEVVLQGAGPRSWAPVPSARGWRWLCGARGFYRGRRGGGAARRRPPPSALGPAADAPHGQPRAQEQPPGRVPAEASAGPRSTTPSAPTSRASWYPTRGNTP